MAGRINVNTAPSAVLLALGQGVNGVQPTDIQNILSNRPVPGSTPPDPIYQTTAWLLVRANLSPSTIKRLEPYITTRSQVYRFQSVGYFERGGPMARIEAVIDTNQGRPRIVSWRDLRDLGRAFDVSQLRGEGQ
jgi:hypothetical protein